MLFCLSIAKYLKKEIQKKQLANLDWVLVFVKFLTFFVLFLFFVLPPNKKSSENLFKKRIETFVVFFFYRQHRVVCRNAKKKIALLTFA